MTPGTHTKKSVQPPPRLILGITLLYWGAITGRPFLALIAAAAVESSNWIRFRWSFDSQATGQAWRITLLIILISGLFIWLDGDRYTALPVLLSWLPILLLPLQFVQNFGIRNYLNLNAFSFFSKLHRERNEALGRAPSVIHFNFGNLYFIVILIATVLGRHAQHPIFFPGMVILVGWLIFTRNRNRLFALLAVVTIGAALGIGGQLGMSMLYEWVTNHSLGGGGFLDTDPTASKTKIGSLGQLKQSTSMLWRLTPESGAIPPKLLRTSTYNHYKGITWRNELPVTDPEDETEFRELSTLALKDGEPYFLLRENMSRQDLTKPLPSFRMRGAAKAEQPIPLPGNTSTLLDFELDTPEINPLGTVIIFPRKPIIEGSVRWNASEATEAPPFPDEDLAINLYEYDGIHEVAESIGLKQLPTTAAKVQRIRQFFLNEFTYVRYLSIPRVHFFKRTPTEIGTFLTTSKRGHCEYFATAAVLLLRAADVPARYSIGYAVKEKDIKRNEWIIRGTHGHAWVRYWDQDAGQWIDFDATPPDWFSMEAQGKPNRFQWLNDSYQRFKEDFFLWRNQPRNRLISSIVMWTLGISVFGFVARRLWKSKLALKASSSPDSHRTALIITTPLHNLEKAAKKHLGERAPGETLVSWLMKLENHGVSKQQLQQVSELHQRLRHDPYPAPEDLRQRLAQLTNQLKAELKAR